MPTLAYPHHLTVTAPAEPAAGDVVGDGGGFGEVAPPVPPPGDAVVWYDGPCDVQDVGQVVPRNATGLPENRADATVFLEDESRVFDIPIGARATVLFAPGATDPRPYTGLVTYARELDGALLIRFPDAG